MSRSGSGPWSPPGGRRPAAGRPVPRALPQRRGGRPAARTTPRQHVDWSRRSAARLRPASGAADDAPRRRAPSCGCVDLRGDLRTRPARRRPAPDRASPPTSTPASSASSATSTTTSAGGARRPRSPSSWAASRCPQRPARTPASTGRSSRAVSWSSRTATARSRAGRCGCPTGSCRTCWATTPRTRRSRGPCPCRRRSRGGTPSPLARGAAARRAARLPARAGDRLRARRGGRGAAPHRARRAGHRPRPSGAGSPTLSTWRGSRPARPGLRGAGLVAGPVAAVKDRPDGAAGARSRPAAAAPRRRRRRGIPRGPAAPPPSWTCPASTTDERARLWRRRRSATGSRALDLAVGDRAVPAPARAGRPGRGVRPGAGVARPRRAPVDAEHLAAGARAENGVGARAARPPGRAGGRLGRPRAAARHRDRAAGGGGAGPAPRAGARRLGACGPAAVAGIGVAALFAGDSGTGKTMSAEVVAGELGLDLYVVDLATVVDKYVGETEKNLERIFAAAAGVNAVLLFDEADAVFGKRSEVKRRARPLRQRRERLPAAADGDASTASPSWRPTCAPTSTRRSPAGSTCIVDFPHAGRRHRARALGRAASARRARVRRPRPRLPAPVLRALRRRDPLGRGHGGLPRRQRATVPSRWRTSSRPSSGSTASSAGSVRERVRPLLARRR